MQIGKSRTYRCYQTVIVDATRTDGLKLKVLLRFWSECCPLRHVARTGLISGGRQLSFKAKSDYAHRGIEIDRPPLVSQEDDLSRTSLWTGRYLRFLHLPFHPTGSWLLRNGTLNYNRAHFRHLVHAGQHTTTLGIADTRGLLVAEQPVHFCQWISIYMRRWKPERQ